VTATPQQLGEVMRSILARLPSTMPLELSDLADSCYSPKPASPMFFSGM